MSAYPENSLNCFIRKANLGAVTTGNTNPIREFRPYKIIEGPAIIKVQGTASAADIEASAEFDIILVDN